MYGPRGWSGPEESPAVGAADGDVAGDRTDVAIDEAAGDDNPVTVPAWLSRFQKM